MAQPTDSLDIKDLKDVNAGGLVREDVLDQIYGKDKRGTRFLDLIGRGSFDNSYSEWVEDDLITASASNAYSSGTDYTPTTSPHGTRVGNHAQISRRGVNVTFRAEEADQFGGIMKLGEETARQIQGLRYDQEKIALSGQASVADNPGTTVGKTAGLDAWLKTNTDNGDNGLDGGFNVSTKEVDAPTYGEVRNLSWEQVTDQIENVYTIGCKPTILLTVPALAKRISRYCVKTGFGAQLVANVSGTKPETMVANQYVNVFRTDFGYTMEIADSLHMDTYKVPGVGSPSEPNEDAATVFGIDPEYIELATMYGVRVVPLASNGDYVRKMIQTDWMLKVKLERAHFAIRSINPYADVTD